MELRIITPEEAFLKAVEFNHEEIKQELSIRLEKYQGLVYSDEEIKLAKNDRAMLNKFKTAIEDKRKEIKSQCLAPYDKFEVKVKEILALVDGPMLEIDKQVKGFEEKQKEEKRLIIEGVYAESIGTLGDILPLKKLWNEKWLNATYKLFECTNEILAAIEKTTQDLEVIGNLASEFDLQVKDKYLATLDLSAALKEKTRLEEQKAKMEEYQKQERQRKMKEAEAKVIAEKEREARAAQVAIQLKNKMVEVKVSKEEEPILQGQVEIAVEPTPAPIIEEVQLEEISFRCWVTPEQKAALIDCIRTQKIKCGKV